MQFRCSKKQNLSKIWKNSSKKNTTLLIRAITFSYRLDGAFVVHKEETIVQDVKESYSLDQLIRKAKKYMKAVYDVKNSRIVEVPIKIIKQKEEVKPQKEKLYIRWDPFEKGNKLPLDAVYAGCYKTDGPVHVARFNNSPGKVNFEDGKHSQRIIAGFWTEYFGYRPAGEVLRTNGHCEWKLIKQGQTFPSNAVYSGLDAAKNPAWVGKSTSGEPGRILCPGNETKKLDGGNTMSKLWCHATGGHSECYVLTIS